MSQESGKRLRDFITTRRTDDATWAEWAASVGVTKSAVMAWLAGSHEPDLESLRRVAMVLGVKRWELVKAIDGD